MFFYHLFFLKTVLVSTSSTYSWLECLSAVQLKQAPFCSSPKRQKISPG